MVSLLLIERVYVSMTHPRDVDRPEGVELDEFGDREQNGELFEYVRFSADVTSVDDATVREFKQTLETECSEWDVGLGHNPEAESQVIEMRRVLHRAEDEPPIPDDVLEEEGEYYRKMDEAERDF